MVRKCHTRWWVFVLVPAFMVSCVIHDKFPFICFRSGCVNQEFNLKGFRKRVKGQMAVKARMRDAARNKKEDEKNSVTTSKEQTHKGESKDEINYASKVIYTKYFLKFYVQRDSVAFADSIIVFHTSEGHNITEADQPRLEHFIKKLPARNVNRVDVREVYTGQIKEEMHVIISRQKCIRKFLKQKKISSPVNFQELNG